MTAITTRVGLTEDSVVVADIVVIFAKLLEGIVTRVNVRGVLVTAEVTGLKEMTWLTSMSSSSSCSSSLEMVVDKSVEARADREEATGVGTGSGAVVTGWLVAVAATEAEAEEEVELVQVVAVATGGGVICVTVTVGVMVSVTVGVAGVVDRAEGAMENEKSSAPSVGSPASATTRLGGPADKTPDTAVL